MSENVVAKVIRVIGFIDLIGGILSSLILGCIFTIHGDYNWYVAIIGAVLSFVEGVLFIGFAEIINLLQLNYDKQSQIIREINNSENKLSKTIVVNSPQNTNVDSIPDNSVATECNKSSSRTKKTDHTWRCAKCNKMISELPCPYCGDNFN